MKKQIALRTKKSAALVRLFSLSAVLFLAGCAVSLAPKFDQAIVDNLSASTTDVFQLLASATGGTSKSDFEKREEAYNSLIGKLEALGLQIKARPVPKNKAVDKIVGKANETLTKRGLPAITASDTAPSANALDQVVKNLATMKDADKKQGLTPIEVTAFKNNISLFLDQALTYERYLNN